MEQTKKLNFTDVKKRVGEHLKTALGVEEFELTFAKLEGDAWRANVEFKEKRGAVELSTTALFSIDATTGEVKEFRKGDIWRY